MDKRGIVIGQGYSFRSDGVYPIKLSGQQLRKYLFFWDEIDYPTASFLSEPTNENLDLQFLDSAGVLKRTHLDDINIRIGRPKLVGRTYMFSPFELIAAKAQINAYEKNMKSEPGAWTMGQVSTDELFPEGTTKLGVEFDIYNVVSVPDVTVPLNDILEFKEKHRSELLAFRGYFDEVYQQVISSSDLPRAKNTQISRLEQALTDLDKTLEGAGIRRSVTSLRTYIAAEFASAFSAGLGGYSLGLSSSIEIPPLVIAIASAGITLCIKPIVTPRNEPNGHPFLYLSSIRGLCSTEELRWTLDRLR